MKIKKIISSVLALLLFSGMSAVPVVNAEQSSLITAPFDTCIIRRDSSGDMQYSESGVVTTEWGATTGMKVIFDLTDYKDVYESIKSAKVSVTTRARQNRAEAAYSYLVPTIVDSSDASAEHMEADSEEEKFMSEPYPVGNGLSEVNINNMDITKDLVARIAEQSDSDKIQAAYVLRNETITAGYDIETRNKENEKFMFKLTIVTMEEKDFPTMRKDEISAYMNYYLKNYNEYRAYSELSEAGRNKVVDLIYDSKALINGVENFANLLEDCTEKYFMSQELEEADIDNAAVYYGANTEFYSAMSENGRAQVTEAFLADDRSLMDSKEAFEEILDRAVAGYYAKGEIDKEDVQVEFTLNNGQNLNGEADTSLSALADGITANSANGEVLELENVTISINGSAVNTMVENGRIKFLDEIKPESIYTISWKGIGSGIYDSIYHFTTTGLYVRVDSKILLDSFKEKETIDFKGANAYFSSGRENYITFDKLKVNVADEKTVKYENGVFTALKRGVTFTDITKENENNVPSVNDKRLLFVYNKIIKDKLNQQKQTMTSDFAADAASAIFTAQESVQVTMTAGNETLTVSFENPGTHQLAVYTDNNSMKFYADGELKNTVSYGRFNSLMISVSDENTVDGFDVSLMDIKGTICKADWVTVRSLNNKIIGSYQYSDPDEDDKESEAGSVYKWYSSTSSQGKGNVIQGETGTEISNASRYAGSYIRFEVTPANMHEVGEAVISEAVYIASSQGSGSGSGGTGTTPKKNTSGITGGNAGVILENYTGQKQEDKTTEKDNFTDVSKTHWAYESIKTLTEKGVLAGYTDGSFKPDGDVTRAEFICALVKAAELNNYIYDGRFTDINADDWYAPYVAAGVEMGYINGFEDGSFRANQPITREQLAVIMSKALSLGEAEPISFDDNDDIGVWAYESVERICTFGIMQGRNGNIFAPKEKVTRSEMAAVLSRMLDR